MIQNGTTKLVNVKNQDGLTKILDMVPDFVDRFTSGKGDEESVGESEKNNFCIDYSKPMKKVQKNWKKLFGFMLFFIGIGMIIGMLIAENVVLGGFGRSFPVVGISSFLSLTLQKIANIRLTYEIKKRLSAQAEYSVKNI